MNLHHKAIDSVERWPQWLKTAIASEWTTRIFYAWAGVGIGMVIQAWITC